MNIKPYHNSIFLVFSFILNLPIICPTSSERIFQKQLLKNCTSAEFEALYQLNTSEPRTTIQKDWNAKVDSYHDCFMHTKKVDLILTEDVYLAVNDIFYPPTDFCINHKEHTARICNNPKTRNTAVNKCCPENEIFDLQTRHCRPTSIPYRPKLQTTELVEKSRWSFLAFHVWSNSNGSPLQNQANYHPPPLVMELPASPLVCPKGFDLKIYISEPCSSMQSSSSRFLEELAIYDKAKFYRNHSIYCPHEMPYEICRFQITKSGIEYETASGLFHRKSDVKSLQHGLYCVEGYFNNPLCHFVNRSTDNRNIQEKCVDSLKELLMFCEPGTFVETEQSPQKAFCLASIWISTCPLLVFAAMAQFVTNHKSVHGWTLSCYLLSMFVVNINSAVLALETRSLGCKVTDFSMKFFYLSTLCWLTSINFGLWRTFRSSFPKNVQPHRFIFNMIFSFFVPMIVVVVSYYAAQGDICGSQYCVLYSHNTIPYYNLPVIFLILVNLGLFLRTSIKISELRNETSTVLNQDFNQPRHLESFRLFAKLFLMTGPIWILRVVLFFLQVKGLYFTWYGVILEAVFSIPEAVFSIMVLLHPEFKKWAWQKYPNLPNKNCLFNLFKSN